MAKRFGRKWATRCVVFRKTSIMTSRHSSLIALPPSCYQVGLHRLVPFSQFLDGPFDLFRSAFLCLQDEGSCPPQVKGGHGLEEMLAVEDPIVVSQSKIIHHSNPEVHREPELFPLQESNGQKIG